MEKIRVLILEPGKAARVEKIENTLEAKQKIVGGLIEMHIPPNHDYDVCLLFNEEGKLIGLPPNRQLLMANGEPYDIAMGTIIVLGAPVESDEFIGLTDEQIKKYADMYSKTFVETDDGFELLERRK